MNVIKTAIDGVVILEPRIFKDDRGYFFESFNQREFEEKVCKTTFVQDNESNRVMVYSVVYIFNRPLLLRVNWCV